MIGRVASLLFLLTAVASTASATSVPKPSDCKSNQFWHEPTKCCLPKGGPPAPPPPPPTGVKCPPTGFYWGQKQGCCIPHNPPPPSGPPPQCPNGWSWVPGVKKCLPTPTPPKPPTPGPSGHPGHGHGHGHGYNGGDDDGNDSDDDDDDNHGHGGHHKKRASPARAARLCPSGLEACPLSSLAVGDYECIDIASELESCGGCVARGEGQDCTAIRGAWNVGCEQGTCAVYSCAGGFRLAEDGKSCIEL